MELQVSGPCSWWQCERRVKWMCRCSFASPFRVNVSRVSGASQAHGYKVLLSSVAVCTCHAAIGTSDLSRQFHQLLFQLFAVLVIATNKFCIFWNFFKNSNEMHWLWFIALKQNCDLACSGAKVKCLHFYLLLLFVLHCMWSIANKRTFDFWVDEVLRGSR